MGGRGSKSSRAGGGAAAAAAPATNSLGGPAVGSDAPAEAQTANGKVAGPAQAASGDYLNQIKTGEPVPLKTAGYTTQPVQPVRPGVKFVTRGPDGGSVYSNSKAQAERVAAHLGKFKLPTSLSNVPTSKL